MKKIFKYIILTVCILFFASCSMQDLTPSVPEDNTIEFVVRPTSFLTCNVVSKAEDLTTLDKAVYTGYFLLFNDDGKRVLFEAADIAGDNSYVLNYKYNPVDNAENTAYTELADHIACFIANVPNSIVDEMSKANEEEETTDLQKLQNAVLYLNYADHSSNNGTGYIGIPELTREIVNADGTTTEETVHCLPMFGKIGITGEDVSSSRVIIPLERLFAKVNLTISLNLDGEIDGWTQFIGDNATFTLSSYTLSNLPKAVNLQAQRNPDNNFKESEWAVIDSDSDEYKKYFYTTIDPTEVSIENGDDPYTITCYIPEYFVDSTAKNTDERLKPSFCSEDKNPVYLTIEGNFTHPYLNNNEEIPFIYKAFLGEDEFDSFSLKRNKQYNFYMKITGIDEARLEADDRVTAEIPVINLASHESANCYIISSAGRYMLPLVKGNTDEPIDTPDSYDYSITDNSKNKISNCKIDNGYLIFDVNMDDLAEVTNGNTMLIAKEGSTVLWSWHLWFCENGSRPDDEDVLEKYVGDNGYFNGYYVMNRALGATSYTGLNLSGLGGSDNTRMWTDGLYYQWGRKDPLYIDVTDTGTDGDYDNSILNPNKFYLDWTGEDDGAGWATNAKSVNDPCPPGYKIPSTDVWRSNNPDAAHVTIGSMKVPTSTEYYYTYNFTNTTSGNGNYPSGFIMFPYPSYYVDNEIVEYIDIPLVDPDDGSNLLLSDPEEIISGVNVRVVYSGTYTYKLGSIWGSNGYAYYDRQVYTFDKENVGVFYQTKNIFGKWGSWQPRSPETKNGYNISALGRIPLVGDAIVNYVNDFVEGLKASDTHYSIVNFGNGEGDSNISITKSSALQVRCVTKDSPVQ